MIPRLGALTAPERLFGSSNQSLPDRPRRRARAGDLDLARPPNLPNFRTKIAPPAPFGP
jgi:hypothetical protein